MKFVFMTLVAVVAVSAAWADEAKNSRDPFTPVGYKRPEPKAPVVELPPAQVASPVNTPPRDPPKPDPLVIEKLAAEIQARIRQQCQVSGFWKSSSGQQMAIVNGQIKGVGDKVTVDVDGQTYQFKVTAISPMSVKMEPVN